MRKLKNEELNRLTVEGYKQADKTPIVLVLDNIRSLNNIGSIFRTADAFKLSGISLCGITATPPHRDIQKTALGATDSVHWEYFKETKDAIEKLKAHGFNIYSLEQTVKSVSLHQFQPPQKTKLALVFGHEIHGVQQEIVNLSNDCIEIPQFGTKHSFNVAVSVGIVVWDIYNKIL